MVFVSGNLLRHYIEQELFEILSAYPYLDYDFDKLCIFSDILQGRRLNLESLTLNNVVMLRKLFYLRYLLTDVEVFGNDERCVRISGDIKELFSYILYNNDWFKILLVLLLLG